MIADTADLMGLDHIGLGSDLCQNQPDTVVEWMRSGRWTKSVDFGEGTKDKPGFPKQPDWFVDNRDFKNIEKGLIAVGFGMDEVESILGKNWYNFYTNNFIALD